MAKGGRPLPICCGSADACMMIAPLALSTLLRLAMAGPVYLRSGCKIKHMACLLPTADQQADAADQQHELRPR